VRRRAALWGALAVVLIAAAVVLTRPAVLASWVPRVISLATGYDVRWFHLQIGDGHLVIEDITAVRGGLRVAGAARIDVAYSLRDLLPGSSHRFGITAVTLDRPSFTLVRNADGSFNVAFPSAQAPGPPEPPNRVPLNLTVRVLHGALSLLAPHALDPQARSIQVREVNIDARIDTDARTHYTMQAQLEQGAAAPSAVRAAGTIDVDRTFAMHHVTAGPLAVRPLANFFINSHAAKLLGGTAAGLDVRAYALDVQPFEPVTYHLSGSVDVADASMQLVGLDVPLNGIAGRVQLVDDTFFFNRLDAALAGIPVVASGGIFNFAQPQFRFGVRGAAQLSDLRKAFAFSRDRDIRGDAKLAVLVEGPLGAPTVQAHVTASNAEYAQVPLHDVDATLAYADSTLYLLPASASAAGARVTLRGALLFGDTNVHSEAALHLTANADRLPYLGEVLGREPVVADVLLDGIDTNFYAYGALASARGVQRAAAVVHADRGGELDVSPLWVHTREANLAGGYHLDRRTDRSAFWLLAEGTRVRAPAGTGFLGDLLDVPPIDGTIDRLAVEGGGRSGARALWAGSVRAHGLTISTVRFTTLDASFAGTLADASASPLRATGPWGSFDGTGAVSLHGLAARGRYAGTLDGLQPFFSGVPAHGALEGNAAIAVMPDGITVQADDMRLHGATVRGIPIERASGTLVVANGTVRVDSATGTVGGGTLVAAGSYDRGITLVANGVDAPAMRALGLPLDAGRVSARGTIAQGAPLPSFTGGVTLAGGRVERYRIAGSGLVALHGSAAKLSSVVGGLDGTYALVSGSLGALDSGAPVYDVHADVPAGDVTAALQTLALPTLASDGTFHAALDVRGSGLHPTARGPIGVPGGSVNGLPFIDGAARIDANTTGLSVRDGHVLVGTSALAFEGGVHPGLSAIEIDAPSTRLEDFNNFFDTGDTLDGSGTATFAFVSQGHHLSTAGNVNLTGFRYRNLDIGTTAATWSSARNTVTGSLAAGGQGGGSLKASGSMHVEPSARWQRTLLDSTYQLSFDLVQLDLAKWVAVLGFPELPIAGRIDADAKIDGRYPRVRLQGTTTMTGGAIWRLPIESFDAQFSSHGNRVRLDSASLVSNGITATATGEGGLAMNDPINASIYLNSDDLPSLVTQLWHRQVDVSGLFESTVTIGGTLAKPTFNAAFDASDAKLYGVDVPLLFGAVRLNGAALELRNAGVQFKKGNVTISGSLPLQLAPFGVGPGKAPVSLDLAVDGLDPSIFDTIAGNATQLSGSIDGQLGIGGTIERPRIAGEFGVTNGSYVSSFEREPITGISGIVTFDRTEATLSGFAAKLGKGTLGATARVSFVQGASFALAAQAHDAQLAFPDYGAGTVNAAISLTRAAGAPAKLFGSFTLDNAVIPFAAFVNGAGVASAASAGALPQLPLDFDLSMTAGKSVRVRGSGYGAGLDIGAAGTVHLEGTFEKPSIAGKYTSTGGTLIYFDRAFKVQNASVTFDPAAGIIPDLKATGTTRVATGDLYGAADIYLSISGPIDGLKLSFSSNPPGYTDQQILAMIAPFGGLISRGGYLPGTGPTGIGGVPVYGALSPVPGAQSVAGTTAGSVSVGEEAFNILNAQFAAGLLSPVESALSQGLGFDSVSLTVDYYGDVGFSATRFLGRTLNFVYSSSFGSYSRQSFGLQLLGAKNTSAQLSFFFENGAQRIFTAPSPSASSNSRLDLGLPLQGQSGFAFTLQRLFW
jgi:hypothetical protein